VDLSYVRSELASHMTQDFWANGGTHVRNVFWIGVLAVVPFCFSQRRGAILSGSELHHFEPRLMRGDGTPRSSS
jgi:hypothetical protein